MLDHAMDMADELMILTALCMVHQILQHPWQLVLVDQARLLDSWQKSSE